MCAPSLWKPNQLLMVHWSPHSEFGFIREILYRVALFTNRTVVLDKLKMVKAPVLDEIV